MMVRDEKLLITLIAGILEYVLHKNKENLNIHNPHN